MNKNGMDQLTNALAMHDLYRVFINTAITSGFAYAAGDTSITDTCTAVNEAARKSYECAKRIVPSLFAYTSVDQELENAYLASFVFAACTVPSDVDF